MNFFFPTSEYDGLSPQVTAKAAQRFVSYLRSLPTNTVSDAWLTTGFAAAKEEAQQNNSLIFLYLHSPLHPQSERFCRTVLCHESMVEWLGNPNVAPLGYSIHTAQGAQLAQLLQATCFPLIALLQQPLSTSTTTSSSSTMNLLLRAEGPALLKWPVGNILPYLQSSLTRHETLLAEDLVRRLEREREAELRRQQDDEYHAALQADQERERQRIELEQAERQAEQSLRDALAEARAKVGDEPESGTVIRFTLPSGVKLNRRFVSTETIGTLKAFLTIYFHENEMEMGSIGLSTAFPRKSYQNDNETLDDAGLSPQAVLMVQDLDA